MVQDFCGLERSASSLQGNEGGVVGVVGGFARSTVSKWSGERSSSPLGQTGAVERVCLKMVRREVKLTTGQ